MAEEQVAHYDAAGAVVGAVPRRRMRAEGLWHASGCVLVRSGDGDRVYVHRRTGIKDVYPGLDDCWAGGVVAAGEDPRQCAEREVAEELGVSGAPLVPLFTLSVEIPPLRVHLHTHEVRWDGPFRLQDSEVVSGQWWTLEVLRARVDDPRWPLVPDGRIAARAWLDRHDQAQSTKVSR